ncbi:hypothetical protein DL767_003662 [Monosporascus sp. MG133]|nr:hypothetical protein DL767_003662 [Monosporascus sp. MG133]
MRFSITALVSFVAGVLAMPHHQPAVLPRDLTVRAAQNLCGNNLVLSCCNEVEGDDTNLGSGLLGGLLQGADLDLFSNCSPLDVTVIGITDLLNDQCTQSVACCQGNDIEQSGLVNIGCLALGGLL